MSLLRQEEPRRCEACDTVTPHRRHALERRWSCVRCADRERDPDHATMTFGGFLGVSLAIWRPARRRRRHSG